MLRSMADLAATNAAIEKIIQSKPQLPATQEQAWEILRACGVADENNKIVDAYKEIFIIREKI